MPEHRTVTREAWDAARAELLKREKELTRMGDKLARQRKELPWVRVEKEYTFQTVSAWVDQLPEFVSRSFGTSGRPKSRCRV